MINEINLQNLKESTLSTSTDKENSNISTTTDANSNNLQELAINDEESKLLAPNVEKEHLRESNIINQIINDLGNSFYLIRFVIFSIFICFSDGAEMVVLSLLMRRFENLWHLSAFQKAFLGSSIFIGFIFGALFSGQLMDKKGRRFTLTAGSLILLVFGLMSSFANHFLLFLFFRIGVGVGIGFIIPTNQTYLTELAPANLRGFYSVFIWIGFPLGELYICFISSMFPLDNTTTHHGNWSLIMMFAALPVYLSS